MPNNARAIVDYAYNDEGKEMRDALYASIYDRVSAHIDNRKVEIARNLIVPENSDSSEPAPTE